jgi:hypothetical protein
MFAAIDRWITADPGGRNTQQLYTAASDGDPLVEAAATSLLGAAEAGQPVIVATGFPIPPSHQPETDGPLGAVVVADALAALGAEPVVVAEPAVAEPVSAIADALGSDAIETVSLSPPESTARSLLDREPGAVVAVEKPGVTADGSYRSMSGADISPAVDGVDPLIEAARERGIPTVGVGDGGNEVGMGAVQSAVECHIDHGETIACHTPVDDLVVAGVSNWGAYGIVAALSLETGRELLHTGATERELLAAAIEAGCVDGVTGEATPSVDGISGGVHARVVDLLTDACAAEIDSD